MSTAPPPRDPYADAPTGELADPLLPRWFVLLAVALVPVALVVFLVAFPFLTRGEEVPVAERRPAPAADAPLSHDAGALELGPTDPVAARAGCPAVDGFAVAGTDQDRRRLELALDALCEVGVPDGAGPAVASLRDDGAVIRFAGFERTGVDSVVDVERDPPLVAVNARFAQVEQPRWVTPLVVHDAVVRDGGVGDAATALAARQAELATCEALFEPDDFSRSCHDAAELLALDDPLAALRDVGYE